ncbi:MAG: Resolvase, holliday junction-type, YqgF-like protein [Parcubacteria bacterium C7867-005]|nr:MAG: Resolvase, holliday junction-type, YqgF-like protein [Parcubacteria bacterium C7867-005]
MKILAVDYGAKRVGVASTDESGQFALPRVVLPNDPNLLNDISQMVRESKIERVVVGESKNLDGKHNPIFEEIKLFINDLKSRGFDVVLHPEVYTSMEADRLQGKTTMRDASAAALILKSYIDSNK